MLPYIPADHEKSKEMGKNGRNYLEKELNGQKAYEKIMKDIKNIGETNA